MGYIAMLFLFLNLIFIVIGKAYFEIEMIIALFLIIIIIDIIYMCAIKKLKVIYSIYRKWFEGLVLDNNNWRELLINIRKLIVINYLLAFVIMILYFFISAFLAIINVRIPIFYYPMTCIITNILQTVVLYNGMILAPIYILISWKLNKYFH